MLLKFLVIISTGSQIYYCISILTLQLLAKENEINQTSHSDYRLMSSRKIIILAHGTHPEVLHHKETSHSINQKPHVKNRSSFMV
jgi:hypothetical protein